MYSSNVDLLTGMLNSWAPLAKLRPTLTQLVVQSLADWTPAQFAARPFAATKSVEKAVRILLVHLSR
jgi:symplekin